jgi:hypothetical protein
MSRSRGFVRAQCLHMSGEKPQMPPWLVGLILAVALFIVIILLANILGYGDDPSLGSLG